MLSSSKHEIIKHKIIYFYFGSTRKYEKEHLTELSKQLDDLLCLLKTSLCECDDTIEILIYISYFTLLFKLIVYTRDIYEGKGERELTYMMIDIWYRYFPILAKHILEIIPENYGSWKDLKYFCKYTKNEKYIDYCIELWNNQLQKDVNNKNISIVSKWIPREKSVFGWLFEKSAIDWYFRNYLTNNNANTNIKMNNIKKEYRFILSSLNRKLRTPQIKETERKWSEIKPEEISVTTKSKQYNTFMNINKDKNPDRIQCEYNFQKYFSEAKNIELWTRQFRILRLFSLKTPTKWAELNEQKFTSCASSMRNGVNKKSFHLGEYIKNPHKQNQKYWDEIKKDILHSKSRNHSEKYLLPIIDISVIHPDEYMNAIGIGCMISEISKIHNRIIVYDQQASWINLTGCDLETKIQKIKEKTVLKGKSNLLSAIELIKMAKPDKNLILIIIGDLIDTTKLFDSKESPKIIFWNIGSKIPKPLIMDNNIFISGTSSSIIKYLYENLEIITHDEMDSYSFIKNLVNQTRYLSVEDFFQQKIINENIY